jgi:hypothetical protein
MNKENEKSKPIYIPIDYEDAVKLLKSDPERAINMVLDAEEEQRLREARERVESLFHGYDME